MAAIGVVIPAYNPQADHLARAVRSVRSQTLTDWACVIVDDGSAAPVSLDSVTLGEDIVLIRQENQGVAATRNRGAALVDGEYFAFLDQDDEWFPEKLARQVSFMQRNDLVMCDTDFNIVCDGRILGNGYEHHRGDFFRLLSTARMGMSTLMVRRDAFVAVSGFNTALWIATDWDFQLRVAAAGLKFDRLQQTLCSYHLHGQNRSSNYRVMYRAQMDILRSYANDNRPAARVAVRGGRKRMRQLHAYQALDAYRSTRDPGHLVWAAQRAPCVVTHSVLAKIAGRK